MGKPLAVMLINRDATVTVCHSKTRNLTDYTKRADILVAAVGRPNFIKAAMVKTGAIVLMSGLIKLTGNWLEMWILRRLLKSVFY